MDSFILCMFDCVMEVKTRSVLLQFNPFFFPESEVFISQIDRKEEMPILQLEVNQV